MDQFYSSKTLLKLAGGGMHPPLDPPLPRLEPPTSHTDSNVL